MLRPLDERLDRLIEDVTTLNPNHGADWQEIVDEVQAMLREGYAPTVEELVSGLGERGMEEDSFPGFRRRLRRLGLR